VADLLRCADVIEAIARVSVLSDHKHQYIKVQNDTPTPDHKCTCDQWFEPYGAKYDEANRVDFIVGVGFAKHQAAARFEALVAAGLAAVPTDGETER